MQLTNAVQKQIEQWIQTDQSYAKFARSAEKSRKAIEPLLKELADSEEFLRVTLLAHIRLSKKTRKEIRRHAETAERHSFLAGKRRGYLREHFVNNYYEQCQRDELRRHPKPQPLPAGTPPHEQNH